MKSSQNEHEGKEGRGGGVLRNNEKKTPPSSTPSHSGSRCRFPSILKNEDFQSSLPTDTTGKSCSSTSSGSSTSTAGTVQSTSHRPNTTKGVTFDESVDFSQKSTPRTRMKKQNNDSHNSHRLRSSKNKKQWKEPRQSTFSRMESSYMSAL